MKKQYQLLTLALIVNLHLSAQETYASTVINFSSQYTTTSWSASKLIGAPDTYPSYGDIPTSWASASPDNQREHFTLGFGAGIQATHIGIFETYNPGAVDSIYVKYGNSSTFTLVWSATAAPAGSVRLLDVTIPANALPVTAVRVALNSPLVSGWNEIDAVAISDQPISGNSGGGGTSGGDCGGNNPDTPNTPGTADVLELIAHYSLDGNANDMSNYGNHGTVSGTAVYGPDQNGIPNQAMEFASLSYVQVPASASLNSPEQAISIAAWIKPNNASWNSIVCKSNAGEAHYRMGIASNQNYFSFQGQLNWHTMSPIDLGEWHHVVGIRTPTEYKIYIDGVLIDTQTSTTNSSSTYCADANLYIGYDPALGDDYLVGSISDVKIYRGALSESEVSTMYDFELGVSKKSSHQVSITPNPANNEVVVYHNFSDNNGTISLIDINGKRILNENLKMLNHQIDLSTIDEGIYFVIIKNDKEIQSTKKLVVKH